MLQKWRKNETAAVYAKGLIFNDFERSVSELHFILSQLWIKYGISKYIEGFKKICNIVTQRQFHTSSPSPGA